jgi:hypothetical protein
MNISMEASNKIPYCVIMGLSISLVLISIGYYDLNEEHETLELNYGYAMDMAKNTLNNPEMVNEIKKRIVESNKINLQI